MGIPAQSTRMQVIIHASELFAANNRSVVIMHQLLSCIPTMFQRLEKFLGLDGRKNAILIMLIESYMPKSDHF